ncbi:MAG: hypothetical protein JKY65_24785 [Planctomycetes bacterium]|nr:hypothetical protein [Planctomycetota bacterium]
MSFGRLGLLLVALTPSLLLLGCDDEPADAQGKAALSQKESGSSQKELGGAKRAQGTSPQAKTSASQASTTGSARRPSRPRPTGPTTSGQEEPKGGPVTGINDALAGQEGPLAIESSLEPKQGEWVARWSIRNRSRKPVFLATQLPTVRNKRIAPDPARIYLRAKDETLYVTKRMWRIPRGVSPLIREVPFLIRLEPGQVHEGAIRLPASLASNYPYRSRRPSGQTLVSRVLISNGYFLESAQPTPSEEYPGLFTVPYTELESQQFVTSEPHPARLSVR